MHTPDVSGNGIYVLFVVVVTYFLHHGGIDDSNGGEVYDVAHRGIHADEVDRLVQTHLDRTDNLAHTHRK